MLHIPLMYHTSQTSNQSDLHALEYYKKHHTCSAFIRLYIVQNNVKSNLRMLHIPLMYHTSQTFNQSDLHALEYYKKHHTCSTFIRLYIVPNNVKCNLRMLHSPPMYHTSQTYSKSDFQYHAHEYTIKSVLGVIHLVHYILLYHTIISIFTESCVSTIICHMM